MADTRSPAQLVVDIASERLGRMREALLLSKQKLQCYRDIHGDEYVGGFEYSALMRKIDEALK